MHASVAQQPVGYLAATRPISVKVFHRHDIDFGWEGAEPLAHACARRGLDPERVLQEIEAEEARGSLVYIRWEARPLRELVEHIVLRYHHPLRQQLPELERCAERVLRLHAEREPERLGEVLATVRRLRQELEPHMAQEEELLFPLLCSKQAASAGELLGTSREEHQRVGECVARMRVLTKNYRVPPHTSPAWNELWVGLQLLEGDLREHMHLESYVLIPRVLAC
jgi:regulator of cell morphogenesis and NO signaling